jgi:hypothetical protein
VIAGSPRFSVLLPTHDRADVLGFAIRSVLAQTEPDFELLVVADGCTDRTAEVLAGFVDPRLRVFDLPKVPYFGYANRNLALRQARGRLVAFAAHDDLLLPDHLARMGALLDGTGAAWGYSRPAWVSTDGVIVPFGVNLGFADEMRAFRERGNTIPAACVVHTRQALEAAGFWPEDVPSAADWVLWRRMLAASGWRAAHLPVPTALHFSAAWKQSRHAGSEDVRRLVAIADSAAWWPAILRHPPAGEPEQARLWSALETGGAAWVEALRGALDAVLARVGWASVHPPGPGDEPTLAAVERLAAERDAAGARLAAEHDAALARLATGHDAALARLVAERDAAATARDGAVAALAAVHASTSWRITAPLRAAARLFGRG